MQFSLLWIPDANAERAPEPARVKSRLLEMLGTFVPGLKQATAIERVNGAARLLYIELPVRGWRAPFFQEDARLSALSLDYPFNARQVLRERNLPCREDDLLLTLCRAMRQQPEPLVRELSPHYSLIWLDRESGQTWIQQDGLGFQQLYEYRGSGMRAFANRIIAFKALGVALEPVREEWALRCAMGYFPRDWTGFKNIAYAAPGARWRIDREGRAHAAHIDVLSEWVQPKRTDLETSQRLAYQAIHGEIQAIKPDLEMRTADLTGGYDSRPVVAAMLKEGLDLAVRVHGKSSTYDVMLARRLAEAAGLALDVQETAGDPPQSAEGIRAHIAQALYWQTGAMEFDTHKSFNYGGDPGGRVHITGLHGEIMRGSYAEKFKLLERRPGEVERTIREGLFQQRLEGLRPALRGHVRAVFDALYAEARAPFADELDAVDYFFLREWVRRSASTRCHYVHPGLVFTPYLSVNCIRAAFLIPAAQRVGRPFHQDLLRRDRPGWLEIPYTHDWFARDRRREQAQSPLARTLRRWGRSLDKRLWGRTNWQRSTSRRDYDPGAYWRAIGQPLIDEALAQPGFWSEVLDPDRAGLLRRKMQDALVVLHGLRVLGDGG